MAVYQLEILDKKNAMKAMKKLAGDVYVEQQKNWVSNARKHNAVYKTFGIKC